ncbi:histidinol-phosphate transaminase [Kiritimatiellota bacterium B12222]|nr:histidinol-phosphate transaminase [Kiritimatiellota bacterium B12222]
MPIRQSIQPLHAYVPGEQPAGQDLLKLNTNENAYPPSPKVFEALGKLTSDDLRKYPQPTGKDLCEAIAQLHGISAEQVLVTNGSDEALALCTRAFCEHGGRVGYLKPSYSLYPVLSDIAELEKVEFPLEADFSWKMPEQVDVDFFFLTQPNAPTSLALSRSQIEELLQRCSGEVLVDEAYVDFADGSMVELMKASDRMLISRTFSKSYSLAGIRLGYLMGPAKLIEALYKIKDSYNTDIFAQRVGLAAVQDQSWMLQNVTAIRGTRERVAKALTVSGFSVMPSQTNFLFAKVPEGEDAQKIFEALRDRQVFVRYFPGELTGDYLRITIGTDEQMDRFLDELDSVRT